MIPLRGLKVNCSAPKAFITISPILETYDKNNEQCEQIIHSNNDQD